MIRKLFGLLNRRDRLRIAGVLVLGIAAGALDIFGVGLVLPYATLLANPEQFVVHPLARRVLGVLGPMSTEDLILLLTPALAGAFILKAAVWTSAKYAQNYVIHELQLHLSGTLIRRYLRMDYLFHVQNNSAELVRNVNDEIRVLIRNIVSPILTIVSECVVVVGILALLLVFSPATTLVAIAFFGIVIFSFQRVLKRRLKLHARQRFDSSVARLKSLNQALGAVKELTILGRTEHFARQYDIDNRDFAHAERFHAFVNQLPRVINETLLVLAMLGVVAVTKLQGAEPTSLLPMLSLFAVAAMRMLPSAGVIMSGVSNIRYYHKALDSVHRDLSRFERGDEGAQGKAGGEEAAGLGPAGDIEATDVHYAYPGTSREALAGISFRIPKGSAVAFVGPSGSGKSTLIDLLVGLLRPSAGRILVGGVDIGTEIVSWRGQIGYIPQRFYLADDTIRRNVAFGLPDGEIDPDRLRRALELAGLDDVVHQLPRGLDTLVGELGGRLSGGQRQRICIARALYGDPSVLVMDEATAALDQASEREIVNALSAYSGSKTIIMVAHRLASVRHCDRIFFIRDGRLAGEGTFDELFEGVDAFRAFAQSTHV
ncbi:MAG: ABC transporter ATP-binding protein [Alphaproteobacteria bacterium]|nr:ABC transporter ATP-binding protein [Alphaproteobacteria bacterium]